jgi:hypothetical protein
MLPISLPIHHRTAAILLLFAVFPFLPLWSDTQILGPSSKSSKLCYCDCDNMHGVRTCTHMCELQKYQDRSWARSCRHSDQQTHSDTTPAPGLHSKQTNRTEEARR